MFAQLRKNLRLTARRFALGSIGTLMDLTGVGFLSASMLMLLLTLTDPITACAIMGGVFLGLGLLLVAEASGPDQRQRNRRPDQTATNDMPPLAAAFMQGMAQGMAQSRTHDHRGRG